MQARLRETRRGRLTQEAIAFGLRVFAVLRRRPEDCRMAGVARGKLPDYLQARRVFNEFAVAVGVGFGVSEPFEEVERRRRWTRRRRVGRRGRRRRWRRRRRWTRRSLFA